MPAASHFLSLRGSSGDALWDMGRWKWDTPCRKWDTPPRDRDMHRRKRDTHTQKVGHAPSGEPAERGRRGRKADGEKRQTGMKGRKARPACAGRAFWRRERQLLPRRIAMRRRIST
ncbi:hypothetical protein GCM10010462_19820 [Microbacterium dextranolyticum]|uniref:Uncharacterized protein n=1 Tax=Microbacterium dextranolyticum TaxID=36806 RepID=A0A9W6HKF4_9MICO|nr:hypothetical protein GCM10017591_04370 [Microbacterium dextranolyticum]